jgi:hypothetical protein
MKSENVSCSQLQIGQVSKTMKVQRTTHTHHSPSPLRDAIEGLYRHAVQLQAVIANIGQLTDGVNWKG